MTPELQKFLHDFNYLTIRDVAELLARRGNPFVMIYEEPGMPNSIQYVMNTNSDHSLLMLGRAFNAIQSQN